MLKQFVYSSIPINFSNYAPLTWYYAKVMLEIIIKMLTHCTKISVRYLVLNKLLRRLRATQHT